MKVMKSMNVLSNGLFYKVKLCFTELIKCDAKELLFVATYYEGDEYVICNIRKEHDNERVVIHSFEGWISNDIGHRLMRHRMITLLEQFYYECNYTFLHFANTIDYSQNNIAHYLISRLGLYIVDALIWYAFFSTPYSLHDYSQPLSRKKYHSQYDYGYELLRN
jgi:hypothetical protein